MEVIVNYYIIQSKRREAIKEGVEEIGIIGNSSVDIGS